MKNKPGYIKVAFAIAAIASLMLAVYICTSATESTSPDLNIEYCSLSLDSDTYIFFAVKSNDPNVRLSTRIETQDGSIEKVYEPQSGQTDIQGEYYTIFKFTGIGAKQMSEDIYVRAFIDNGNGNITYGKPYKYSILQYAYNKLGKTGTASTDESLKKMLVKMLDFGAAAQEYRSYRLDRLANAEFVQVKLSAGTLPDGFKRGLFLEGETVKISAPDYDDSGIPFSHWEDELGTLISTNSEYTLSVENKNKTYSPIYDDKNIETPCNHIGTIVTDISVNPTCTQKGKTEGSHCSACSEIIIAQTDVPAKGHTEVNDIGYAATCTTNGKTDGKHCSICNTVTIPQGIIPATGNHSYNTTGNCNICGKLDPTYYSDGLKFTLNDDGISYKVSDGDDCTDNHIIIPSVYNNLPVTGIGDEAFFRCSFESIFIPNSITFIEDEAFYWCDLTEVTIPASVTNIGERAFQECSNLKKAIINGNNATIGNSAFVECDALKNVTINSGIICIDSNAFKYCTSLETISISNSVTSIGTYAFSYCTSLKNAIIGDGTKNIGSHAFRECTTLKNITIGNSVESIGSYAFYKCTSLESVDIPNSVISIGDYAFEYCSSLAHVTLGNNITNVGDDLFYGCAITTITIPSKLNTIGEGMLYNCIYLRSITIPNSVTKISSNAFRDCSLLTQINFTGTMAEWLDISKASFWKDGTGDFTIYCKDGNLDKNGKQIN